MPSQQKNRNQPNSIITEIFDGKRWEPCGESNENLCLAWAVTIQLPNIGDLFGKCVSYQAKSFSS